MSSQSKASRLEYMTLVSLLRCSREIKTCIKVKVTRRRNLWKSCFRNLPRKVRRSNCLTSHPVSKNFLVRRRKIRMMMHRISMSAKILRLKRIMNLQLSQVLRRR